MASRNGRWVLRTGTCEQSVCIAGHPEIPLTSGILRLEVTVDTKWLPGFLETQEQGSLGPPEINIISLQAPPISSVNLKEMVKSGLH